MPSRNQRAGKRSRAFLWVNVLAAIVILAAAGYSYAWFHYAHRLEAQAQAVLANLNGAATEATCTDLDARGYPLELGLFCSHVGYRDRKAEFGVEAGAFRSGAALYSPLDIAGMVEGPARLTLPDLGTVDVDWKSLGASIHLSTPLPDLLQIAGRGLVLTPRNEAPVPARLDEIAFEARPLDRTDLHLRLRFSGLASTPALPDGASLPPLDGAADIIVEDGIAMLLEQRRSLRGTSVVLNGVSIAMGEGSVAISGPVSVDENGLLNGKLSLELKKPQALAGMMANAVPEMREQIEGVLPALSALGEGTTLPLRLDAGKVFLGFIPLGDIPPLPGPRSGS